MPPSNSESFFKHLHSEHRQHVFVSGETDDFDDKVISRWEDEAFVVTYIPLGDGTAENTAKQQDYYRRIKQTADEKLGVGERYVLVAYEEAASLVLMSSTHSVARRAGVIAYYPTTIPDPAKTTYPPDMRVLIHLATPDVGIVHTPEILGIQGHPKVVQKSISHGTGVGGELRIGKYAKTANGPPASGCRMFVYPDCVAGFAESDLDDYNSRDMKLAWTRDLALAKSVFGIEDSGLETLRDEFLDDVVHERIELSAFDLSLNGRSALYSPKKSYYLTLFGNGNETVDLVSRTVSGNQVVDEVQLNLPADRAHEWVISGEKLTGKRRINTTIVSITEFRGSRVVRERVCWDQAAVNRQIEGVDEDSEDTEGDDEVNDDEVSDEEERL